MRLSEIGRLVWLNLIQNKFKVFLTSTGIIVGSATIMLVIAIGTGGKLEVAEQFKNLNAGSIDISYEYNGSGFTGGMSGGGMPGGGMPGGGAGSAMPGGGMGGRFSPFDGMGNQMNMTRITLSQEDADNLKESIPEIASATISYTTRQEAEGGSMDESASYTIAGVKENYADISNLEMAIGAFLTKDNDTYKERTCVLGYSVAKEMFDSVLDAYDSPVYIDNRSYVVSGVLMEMGTVASGISPDEAIFIPYETGIKYLTGKDVSPAITVVAEDVNDVESVMEQIVPVLAETYGEKVEFTISDAGSKMEAASKSNETLTLLLMAMAAIVFIVGGIGIMNVLFVSVKERTNEIGILKAIGCDQKDILTEFLLEASCISFVGAVLGVLVSLGITPVIEGFSVRVELSLGGGVLSLLFGVMTGTVFGFYPALKASRLIPVVALNHE
ncbi:FtsX-like permease family protein [Parablautia intestinalis]|jgi:ABC-type antimicrobial peptide transport system permease subunit|uniref:FtsX-like permease family protein n=1 Tax=Parablautia intestinalis TaxID=2320100 RepID=A0A3A9AG82_9FIRM|nr:ABC transporter permease [Parablautia intestinalis]MCI8613831.1 FtsX-like permease family protein [Lachnospiraceae bacterium]RKI90640.1 FtsX-like permease family protein [Parablautia intestinalis]